MSDFDYMLYYRNVPCDVVGVWVGSYDVLRKLELEIRAKDPGNYLALAKVNPVTEDNLKQNIDEIMGYLGNG